MCKVYVGCGLDLLVGQEALEMSDLGILLKLTATTNRDGMGAIRV